MSIALMFMGAALLLTAPSSVLSEDCPPPGFDTQANFDLKKFIDGPWFVQQQEPLLYQQKENLYCVRSLYKPLDGDIENGLRVYNYANEGEVNGPSIGDISFIGLDFDTIALREDKDDKSSTAASKLMVGPRLPRWMKRLQNKVMSSYWVAAAGALGSATDGYDWAIIIGGEPEYEAGSSGEGCRANTGAEIAGRGLSRFSYKGGLWLFSRKPVDPEATAAMIKIAKDMGLDVSRLVNVPQEGCKYNGAQN